MWKAGKFLNILLWVLSLISVGLCAYAFQKAGSLEKTQNAELLNAINPMFIWIYILVGITAFVAIVLPIPQLIENPKSAVGLFVGLACFAAVVGLAFLFAKGDPLPFTNVTKVVSEGVIKFADVNLISVYIMLGATIFVTIAASIWNVIKMK